MKSRSAARSYSMCCCLDAMKRPPAARKQIFPSRNKQEGGSAGARSKKPVPVQDASRPSACTLAFLAAGQDRGDASAPLIRHQQHH